MQMLKDAILERGKALNQDVLLVDSFLNHQVDVALMEEIGEEFAKYFAGRGITRVVTIESSGIAPASFTALALGLPLVIMKKQTSRILKGFCLPVKKFYSLMIFLPAEKRLSALFIWHSRRAQRSPELASLLKRRFKVAINGWQTKAWTCIRWHVLRLCPQMPSPLQNNQSLRWATAFRVLFLPRIWNWMHAFSVKSAKKANYRCNEQQNMI